MIHWRLYLYTKSLIMYTQNSCIFNNLKTPLFEDFNQKGFVNDSLS